MSRTAHLMRTVVAATMIAAVAITAGAPAVAEMGDAELTDELVALERTKLDPWYGRASTAVYIFGLADDSTYFDPWAPTKLRGAEVKEYLAGFEGNIPRLAYEITDPYADVRGDIVIFTYDIEMSDPETGEAAGRWMVTEVLNPTDDGWEVIHTHFGLPAPPPEF